MITGIYMITSSQYNIFITGLSTPSIIFICQQY